MKIAILAHSVFEIGEPYKGGLEKFIHKLATTLVKKGIDVTLFCNEKSSEGLYEKRIFTDFKYDYKGNYNSLNDDYKLLVSELKHSQEFDLIHNNSLNTDVLSLTKYNTPVLTTIHVPPILDFQNAILSNFTNCNNFINIVSSSCLKSWKQIDQCPVIHNGLDLSKWDYKTSEKSGAVWFGRICPEKGVERAIQASIKAKMLLTISGNVHSTEYFNYLTKKYKNRFKYVGLSNTKELNTIIKNSKVFINAPVWKEPFGFVYLESLASGTPVATYTSDITKELLNSKVANITDTTINSLGLGAVNAYKLSSEDCRAYVEKNFSLDKCVNQYIKLYKTICTK